MLLRYRGGLQFSNYLVPSSNENRFYVHQVLLVKKKWIVRELNVNDAERNVTLMAKYRTGGIQVTHHWEQ